jgi:excisionase family DNA binding protein
MGVQSGRRKAGHTQPGGRELGVFDLLLEKVDGVGAAVARLHELVEARGPVSGKEWYTTAELAEALGVSQYTVQARWCAEGRIECEKDPDTRKWRIPAREYARLARGGSPRAGRKRR